MKKGKDQQEYQATFEDADYQIDMRVDPLTTTDTIKQEYNELQEKFKQKQEKQKNKNNRIVSEDEGRIFAKQDETIARDDTK